MTLIFQRLTPKHVDQLVEMEQDTFPPLFHLGAAKFYYFLSTSEVKGRNYSVGVFDKGKLVGYILMVNHPSDFFPGEEVAYVISIAVRFRYRRTAVKPLIEWMVREALLTGNSVEGKMRESTAFRMILRNAMMIRGEGFRISQIREIDRVGKDRMINVRFDHVFTRDWLLLRVYQSLTGVERTRRMLRALPRRALRRVCRSLPSNLVPEQFLRMSYLVNPQVQVGQGE